MSWWNIESLGKISFIKIKILINILLNLFEMSEANPCCSCVFIDFLYSPLLMGFLGGVDDFRGKK